MTRAIDCLVNVDFADRPVPTYMKRVRDDYFKGGEKFLSSPELNELLEDMDEHGIERVILLSQLAQTEGRALEFAEARPDRFSLAVGGHDLLKPMKNLRELEAYVKNLPVVTTIIGPSFWGDGMYPPTDAVYFPLYTKCCELGLPLTMNMGIPGPPLPADPQNPIHLDRVCYRFPELKLCMAHGADPWWDVAIRLMVKYPNLRLMTSAWSPRYLPEVLLHFMRTRGKNRIIFGSDYPVLSFERTLSEAQALDLPTDVLNGWLHGNAASFFFGEGD